MYYSKYIKYKTKYLNLQSGGMHAPDEEPDHITSKSSLIKSDTVSILTASTTQSVDDKLMHVVNPLATTQTVVNSSSSIDPNIFNPTITSVCCTEDTQFPRRMWACGETTMHNVVSTAAQLAEIIGFHTNASLDGVVRLSYRSMYTATESVQMIKDGHNNDEYISDHDGVNVNVTLYETRADILKPINFNIVTYNLEGLCSKDADRYEFIKAKLKLWFAPYIKPGTLFVLQEVALQMKKGPEEQTKILNTNFEIVLDALKSINDNLKGETDGYTGCMIYDSAVWELSETVIIQRENSSKFSNAYLMKYIDNPKYFIWLINIHLEAPNLMNIKMYSQQHVNKIHINELDNILRTVLKRNHMKYPVYLCGDFNNRGPKQYLVNEVLRNLEGELKMQIAEADGDEFQIGGGVTNERCMHCGEGFIETYDIDPLALRKFMILHRKCSKDINDQKISLRDEIIKKSNLKDVKESCEKINGELKGICGDCGNQVTDENARVRIDHYNKSTYYHAICPLNPSFVKSKPIDVFESIFPRSTIPLSEQLGINDSTICYSCDKKISFDKIFIKIHPGRVYHLGCIYCVHCGKGFNSIDEMRTLANTLRQPLHHKCSKDIKDNKISLRDEIIRKSNLKDVTEDCKIKDGEIKGLCADCGKPVTDRNSRLRVHHYKESTIYHAICP